MILATASLWNVGLATVTALTYCVPALLSARIAPAAARVWVMLAWLLHGATLILGLVGDVPVFGFAPALSACAWLVAAIYAVESQVFPRLQTRWTLALLGALSVIAAQVFPGTVHISDMHSLLLVLHLLLGLGSYALFACAAIHAWVLVRSEERLRQAIEPAAGLPLLTLERLTYRFAWAGFVMLSLTLLLGAVFAQSIHGAHGWRWDHKTVFSLLAWLTFASLLAGRQWRGWRGKDAVRMLYAGSLLLLLAYAGSRFVLEVILGRTP